MGDSRPGGSVGFCLLYRILSIHYGSTAGRLVPHRHPPHFGVPGHVGAPSSDGAPIFRFGGGYAAAMPAPYPFEDRPSVRLAGWAVPATNDDPACIGALWQRVMAEDLATQVQGRLSRVVHAVYSEYEGDHTKPYVFFLGYPISDDVPVPDALVVRELPAGPYARIDAVGEQPAALIQAWMGIWTSGLERSFQMDYELHDPDTPDRVRIYVR